MVRGMKTSLSSPQLLVALPRAALRAVTRRTHAHAALLGTLLELDAELIEALASGVEVVDGDADVAEAAAGLVVARGVALEAGVGLWV